MIAGVIRQGDKTDNLPKESELYQNISGNNNSSILINGAVEDSIGDYYFDSGMWWTLPRKKGGNETESM